MCVSGKSSGWPENPPWEMDNPCSHQRCCSAQLGMCVSLTDSKCEVKFQKTGGIHDHLYLIQGKQIFVDEALISRLLAGWLLFVCK